MTNAPSTFYLPPKSLTGRMGHSKPAIQILPSISGNPLPAWSKELDKIRKLSQQSKLMGKVFEVTQQEKLKRGDLVVWSGKGRSKGTPGLWRVTDINYPYEPGEVNYRTIETSVATNQNPCGEIELSTGEKCKLRVRRVSVPQDKVRLEWEGGWGGYCNDQHPVIVKIAEVYLANEMEALGIAAL